MQGLLGKKIGMTRVFDAKGQQIPVTLIQLGPCVVLQRKTTVTDGYESVQCGFEDCREKRAGKALNGHFKKAGCAPKRYVQEFALDAGEDPKVGDKLTVSMFDGIEYVDISGVTKGQGFQGVMKRHGMAGGPASHGHTSKRRIGAIGARAKPGLIHKNKRMPGHMGHKNVTAQNLQVVKLMPEENLMLVHGAIMGPAGGLVTVRKSVKKTAVKK